MHTPLEERERQPQRTVRRHPRCMTASERLPQGSDSTTRADMPATAMPATSSMAGSTPLDGVDVSTPNMTGASHRSLRAPVCSAGRFVPLLFPHAFDSPLPSSSTQARPIPQSGSTTTFTLLTPHERGLSTCPRTRSTTGPTWSRSSWATSRARTCALGTLGTSRVSPEAQ